MDSGAVEEDEAAVKSFNVSIVCELLLETLPQICIVIYNWRSLGAPMDDTFFFAKVSMSLYTFLDGVVPIMFWVGQLGFSEGIKVNLYDPWECKDPGCSKKAPPKGKLALLFTCLVWLPKKACRACGCLKKAPAGVPWMVSPMHLKCTADGCNGRHPKWVDKNAGAPAAGTGTSTTAIAVQAAASSQSRVV
jgi:hypothetical protein